MRGSNTPANQHLACWKSEREREIGERQTEKRVTGEREREMKDERKRD